MERRKILFRKEFKLNTDLQNQIIIDSLLPFLVQS